MGKQARCWDALWHRDRKPPIHGQRHTDNYSTSLETHCTHTIARHANDSISEAQAPQSNPSVYPSVYRSEAAFPQPVLDLGLHFLLADKYFPLLPFLLSSHHLSHSQPENRMEVVGQVLHRSFIYLCTRPSAGPLICLMREAQLKQVLTWVTDEQAHLAQHITQESNWMGGASLGPKLPMQKASISC